MTEQGTFFPFMTPVEHADFLEDYYDRFNRERYLKLLEYFELPKGKKARTFSTGRRQSLKFQSASPRDAAIYSSTSRFSAMTCLHGVIFCG